MSLTCQDVMERELTTLKPTDSVQAAFDLIRQDGHRFLPVVDEDGKYLGVFTAVTLMRNLLPTAATIDVLGDYIGTPDHLKFIRLDANDLKERAKELDNENVMAYLSKPENIPVANPDTPLLEVMLLINRFKRHVIVVDKDTNKLVGIATANKILATLFN